MSNLEDLAWSVRANNAEPLLEKVCSHTQSHRDGFLGVGGAEKFKGGVRVSPSAKVDALVAMRLAKRDRDKVRATALGFSVSTRLAVMKAQQR